MNIIAILLLFIICLILSSFAGVAKFCTFCDPMCIGVPYLSVGPCETFTCCMGAGCLRVGVGEIAKMALGGGGDGEEGEGGGGGAAPALLDLCKVKAVLATNA